MISRGALFLLFNNTSADFRLPSRHELMKAVGILKDLPPNIQKVFKPGDDFNPVPVPGPQDWLTIHKEPG